jgi:hypothetical protein
MNKELRDYIGQVKVGFINDPADSDYQRGYLTAILDIEDFMEGLE